MPKTITDLTFTRGTGATRFNEFGNLVGVDFSTTSLTIGTGPQTFTLLATGDRDWSPGQGVIAVAQAGATGSMTGTVTSYNPTTQALVINVASITGSGTGTDWRIGSLDLRRTFDPVTGRSLGFLSEAQRTNSIRNSTARGAVAGTPGTVPTNSSGGVANGLSRDIGVGSESGIPYLDIRLYGTPNGSGAFSYDVEGLSTQIVASAGQTWVSSAFVRLAAGSLTNIASVRLQVLERPSGNDSQLIFSPTSAPLCTQRQVVTRLLASGSTNVQHRIQIYYTSGLPIDITLRIGLPQLEQGIGATSPIPTSSVAITRASDLAALSGDPFALSYGSSTGTLVAELSTPSGVESTRAFTITDAAAQNSLMIQRRGIGTTQGILSLASDGVTDVATLNATSTRALLSGEGLGFTERLAPRDFVLNSVASIGAGNFITVGVSETINSTTGTTTVDATVGRGELRKPCYGIGRYVVVDDSATAPAVRVSEDDGVSWRRANIAGLSSALTSVTSNGTNQYVAVGDAGVIVSSPDALNWTVRTSGTTVANFIRVAFGGGAYVAVPGNAQPIRRSTDGINWVGITAFGGNAAVGDVTWTGSQFVAVLADRSIWTSANGSTWTQVTTTGIAATLGSPRAIDFDNGFYVIAGDNGNVALASAAANAAPTTWTTYTNTTSPSTGTTAGIFDATHFGGFFWFVGNGSLNLRFDPVALTFSIQGTGGVVGGLRGTTASPTSVIVTGPNGGLAVSTNANTFTSRTANGATLNGSAFGNGVAVIGGNAVNGSGVIATVDPTTLTFNRRVSNTTQNVNAIDFAGGAFYACTTGTIQRSSDGATWTTGTVGGTSFAIRGLAFDGTTLVAVGDGGRYTTSLNGTTWTNSALNGVTTQNLRDIEWFGGLFVAVGAGGVIITSPNGTAWTARTSGVAVQLNAVMYSLRDACWYAAGASGVMIRSDNGIDWTSINNDALVAIRNTGVVSSILRSDKFIANGRNRIAVSWTAGGTLAYSINGASPVSVALGAMPAVDRLVLGNNASGALALNGTIKLSRLYNNPTTTAELQALSRI